MKNIAAATLLGLSLCSSAIAGGYGYHGNYGYRGNYNNNNNWNYAGAALGGAIIGGLIGSALSQPSAPPMYVQPPIYMAPPSVYMAPPSVYMAPPVCQPKIVQDQYGNYVTATVCYNR